ncbi:MAG: radical SAM protein [Candidatus Omnitrophota bacterium]
MTRGSYVKKERIERTLFWKDKKPLLCRLDMELTERCNNNCIHCCINLPADDLKAKERELAGEKIKNILEEAVSLDCMSVRFTGGEPLLREDFQDLYLFARKKGLKVLIFTNATLITPQIIDLFSRVPPLEKIEVTVYGMKQDSYETVTRIPGSFEAAWRGINLLMEKKIPFVVKGALLPCNKDEIDGFESWAKKIPWMDGKPPGYSMFLDLRCRRDGNKNESIKKLRVTPQEGLEVLTRKKNSYIKGMKEFCSKFMYPPGENIFSCGAGCVGCVDAYGNFQACLMLRHPDTVYDLKKGSLNNALTNFLPKLRGIKSSNVDYLNRCARCFLKGLCEQCPAKSWMEHGTLDTPVEYLCEVAHTQARFLGLLKENEMAWEIDHWQGRIRKFLNTN